MTLRVSEWQSESDMDGISNFCDVLWRKNCFRMFVKKLYLRDYIWYLRYFKYNRKNVNLLSFFICLSVQISSHELKMNKTPSEVKTVTALPKRLTLKLSLNPRCMVIPFWFWFQNLWFCERAGAVEQWQKLQQPLSQISALSHWFFPRQQWYTRRGKYCPFEACAYWTGLSKRAFT